MRLELYLSFKYTFMEALFMLSDTFKIGDNEIKWSRS